MGLDLIQKVENPDEQFDQYFLGYNSAKALNHGLNLTDREGVLCLRHEYVTGLDPNFRFANGNSDPGKGFGHVCISVDNLQAACQRIEDAGYEFKKRLTDGKMKNIAFVLDPDGYWVEIIGQNPLEKTAESYLLVRGIQYRCEA